MVLIRKYIVLSLLMMMSMLAAAQTMQSASRLFDEGKYAEAAQQNRQLLKKSPKDGLLNYRLARCLEADKQFDEAVHYYTLAAEYNYERAYLRLAEYYFGNYFFTEAVDAYEHWLESEKLTESEKISAETQLKRAILGEQLLGRIEDIALIDSVVVPMSQVLDCVKLSVEMGKFSFAANNQIQYESGRGDRRYSVAQNDGQTDIYLSQKLLNSWSQVALLAAGLNTEQDEMSPFVSADGVTIYFASKGYDNMGGYDLFMSRYVSEDDSYLPPKNMGFPFNSTANDYLMALDELHNIGWFVSDRHCSGDSVVVYRYILNDEHRICRNLSPEDLRATARLQKYRIGQLPIEESIAETIKQQTHTERFFVNDSLSYATDNEFVSDEARVRFLQWRNAQTTLAQKQFTLTAKRELWEISDEERGELGKEIVDLERQILVLKRDIAELENEIREYEQKAFRADK